jgi:hypothetical protein
MEVHGSIEFGLILALRASLDRLSAEAAHADDIGSVVITFLPQGMLQEIAALEQYDEFR